MKWYIFFKIMLYFLSFKQIIQITHSLKEDYHDKYVML